MYLRYLRLATAIVAIMLTAAACGGASTTSTATATARAATSTPRPPATATAPAPVGTPRPATPAPPTAFATETAAAGRIFEPAPIDGAEMIVRETFPPQYAVRVLSGLPSGCHQFAGATVSRSGGEITIAVRNSLPSDRGIACTAIYGTHEEIVELGSDFQSGVVYHVAVNDRALTFTAQ